MTITFTSNATRSISVVKEACLCAQMAPGWFSASAAVLREHAYAACPSCAGTGVELVEKSDEPVLNVANGNAPALLSLLGLGARLYGEASLPEMRRALMRARSTFAQRAPWLTRAPKTMRGAHARADGVIELRPRAHVAGLDAAQIGRYLDTLQALVDYAAQRDGTVIRWG